MGKEVYERKVNYKPYADSKRFWIYPESGYTEAEINFRTWVINARKHSGIHPDYLSFPSSWFSDDNQGLVDINQNSYFFSSTFRPQHTLSRDDFYVQPINGQNLQWPQLYDLMQDLGDYLIVRNQKASVEHLNQPMNYVLLDLNHMLRQLSQNTNINLVKEQLDLITRYARKIEKNISPLVGSDRLFFANFRTTLDDKVQPMLTVKLESQILRDRLSDLGKNIRQLSEERNRILHFALNTNPVNPHPHEFSSKLINDKSAYPTHIARDCAKPHTTTTPLLLSHKELSQCPKFNLITNDENTLEHYAKAITDLHELDRFQQVLSQVTDLLAQAGEVYTVYQFKNEMQSLFEEIDQFILDSTQNIETVMQSNNQAYFDAIDKKNNLPVWKKYSDEEIKLSNFIKNQDTLAQVPSTAADISKTQKSIKGQVNEIINHLNQPKMIRSDFTTIASKTQELNTIMNSMHHWIKIQHEIKGIEAPKAPETLKLLPPPPITNTLLPDDFNHNITQCEGSSQCDGKQNRTINPAALGLIVALPLSIVAIYLIYKYYKPSSPDTEYPPEYELIKTEVDDVIAQIEGQIDLSSDEDYCILKKWYQDIINDENKDNSNLEDLKTLLEELKQFNSFDIAHSH